MEVDQFEDVQENICGILLHVKGEFGTKFALLVKEISPGYNCFLFLLQKENPCIC